MRFAKTLMLLASASLALAGKARVSRGLFIGEDTSDPSASGVAVFEEPCNHPAAAGTILSGLAMEVEYWPYEQGAAKLQGTYERFMRAVEVFPGFFRMRADEQTFRVSQKDELWAAVEANYPFAESEAVADAVDEMVPKTNEDPELTDWSLGVVIVQKLEEPERGVDVTVTMVNVQVRLTTAHSRRHKVSFPKQDVTMTVRQFGVIALTLENNAERYAQRFPTIDIDNFLDYMTSRDDAEEIHYSQPRALVSRGLFVGEDTTVAGETGQAIFEFPENHAAAAASILQHLANKAQYKPWEMEPKSMGMAMPQFVKNTESFIGFSVKRDDEQVARVSGRETLWAALESMYPYSQAEVVADAVVGMVPRDIGDPSLREWTLSLVVVEKPRGTDEVTVAIVNVDLTLLMDKNGRTLFPAQEVTMHVVRVRVLARILVERSQRLSREIQTVTVKDFVDFMTSTATDMRFKPSRQQKLLWF